VNVLRLTIAEYEALKASLPRGPLGGILWPSGPPPAVLIVPEPHAVVDPALAAFARRYVTTTPGRS
jgi:hypothetical protein